jgi:hypothetical protein
VPGAGGLSPGTYYVRVEDWNDDDTIANYKIRVRTTVCGDGVVEGSSEECDGTPGCAANCQLLAPGPGESIATAQPFPGCPVAPTSTARVDVPSCFPPEGGVHWYSYASASGILSLTANAPGYLALFNSAGQELSCTTDATQQALTSLSLSGGTYYVAVTQPTSFNCLTFQVAPYTGLSGVTTDLNITFPSSPVTDYGMAVSATSIFLGGTSSVFMFPKTGNTSATEHGEMEGLTITHLGYELHFAGGNLISADNTTVTSTNRLYRIFDQGSGAWGPTAWDLSPSYPAGTSFNALTFDGTTMLAATRSMFNVVHFYSFSPAAPNQLVQLGSNTTVDIVTGLAADSQYFYVAGRAPDGEGLFRINRANIAAPAVRLAWLDVSNLHASVVVNSNVSASYLYARAANGDIHVVANPAAVALHGGPISTLGSNSDYAMAYDTALNVIYFFETESNMAGRVRRLQ